MRFDGNMLLWILSYVTKHKVFNLVLISQKFNVTWGIPQGSHCGPLLFNLFINDIDEALKKLQFLVFADVVKIFDRINNVFDAVHLQSSFDNFCDWARVNDITQIQFDYRIWNNNLNMDHVGDLGIIFGRKFNFHEHIENLSSKCIRSSNDFSWTTLKILYCSVVRSTAEYCSVVWIPQYQNTIHELGRV